MHVPVLLDEVLRLLAPERGGTFVDCTVGLGGHARALLQRGATRLVGIDRDRAALAVARAALAEFGNRVELVHADYRQLPRLLDERGLPVVDGILADLGVSSMQLDSGGRGFSFRRDEPLDMRMDESQGETAADLLARAGESELADVIYRFGEERHSRRIARALVRARDERPLRTTGQVADVVRRASRRRGYERIDPATRTFQALRIWVNRELDGLDAFVADAAARLAPGGRLVVVSFHSLEDRIVKHTLRHLEQSTGAGANERAPRAGTTARVPVRVLTRRPIVAGDDEVARNPRARSAKLRAVERTPGVQS